MKALSFSRNLEKANVMVFAALAILIMSVASLMFLDRAQIAMSLRGLVLDSLDSHYQMESAFQIEKEFFNSAMDGLQFSGKLPHHPDGPASEEIQSIIMRYGSTAENAIDLLKHVIETKAMDSEGVIDPDHPYASFDDAFPSDWQDRDESDDLYYQVRYTFTALDPYLSADMSSIAYRYQYMMEVRAYGQTNYSETSAEEIAVITLDIQGAPFSKYSLFRATNTNQNGWLLVFAGGNTTNEIQDAFNGPVHINATPYFYGSPVFGQSFSSVADYADWWFGTAANYTGSPSFNEPYEDAVAPISMPTELFNTLRLAAGDTTENAAANTTPVEADELLGMLTYHAGDTYAADVSEVPDGVYIPMDSDITKNPTGGVYIEGNAAITLNVVQGEGVNEIPTAYFNQIDLSHQGCKFQKINIDPEDGSRPVRTILIGDDPCSVTYVFNADSPAASPEVLNGRLNGNIYVNGEISSLGGESRTRPAIATDFGFTITALRDIRIANDLQYEDVQYVEQFSDGSVGSTPVATPSGSLDGGTHDSTSGDIAPTIAEDSYTVLGLISLKRNVLIHMSAPDNLNLHAAIYAGSPEAEDDDTLLGCGEDLANKKGCGFGNEGWDTNNSQGNLKLLGSVSEYRSQTMGRLSSPPTGYSRKMTYDVRFLQNITPPAFPISTDIQLYPEVSPIQIWKLVSSAD